MLRAQAPAIPISGLVLQRAGRREVALKRHPTGEIAIAIRVRTMLFQVRKLALFLPDE